MMKNAYSYVITYFKYASYLSVLNFELSLEFNVVAMTLLDESRNNNNNDNSRAAEREVNTTQHKPREIQQAKLQRLPVLLLLPRPQDALGVD
jgi:hypothetical protein